MKKIASIFTFILLVLVFCLIMGCGSVSKKPNVILITFDALRADHLGYQGYSKNTSPFLDSLSKTSLVFTNAIAQSASTVPALSAMFTSHFPFRDGAVTKEYTLSQKYMTLAAFLKSKGYDTFAIVGHAYVQRKFGFSQGFDYYDDHYEKWRNSDEMFGRIKELFQKRKWNNKFFLWIHVREPHSPYTPPQVYISKHPDELALEDEKKEIYTIYGKQRLLKKQEIQQFIFQYDGNIRYADDYLKRIFEFLRRRGLFDSAIIIITADHGESLGEHHIFDHNALFYGILHVPLMIRIPGNKGMSFSEPVSSIDIFPTILDLLGYQVDISRLGLRGESLLGKLEADRIQFSEYQDVYSVSKRGWRLYIDVSNRVHQLFHVESDPMESLNSLENHKEIDELLRRDLKAILASAGEEQTKVVNKRALLNNEDIEHLKSLGYLN